MYTAITVSLLFICSVTLTAMVVHTHTTHWIKQQQVQRAHTLTAPAAPTKTGIYTVAVEDYYLVH